MMAFNKKILYRVFSICLIASIFPIPALAVPEDKDCEPTTVETQYNGSLAACLREAADDAYLMLEKTWSHPDPNYRVNYWVEGAAFGTVLNYFLTSLDSPPHPNKELVAKRARDFAQTVVDEYNRAASVPGSACWWDDNGWWTVVAARASAKNNQDLWLEENGKTNLKVKNNKFTYKGGTAEDPASYEIRPGPSRTVRLIFQNIALENWLVMDKNAPDVWDDCQKGGNSRSCLAAFETLEPLHEGGVWNSRWQKREWLFGSKQEQQALKQQCHIPDPSKKSEAPPEYRPTYPDIPVACDPFFGSKDQNTITIDGWPLCGIQNTVTNGVYWVAAARLFTERSGGAAKTKVAFLDKLVSSSKQKGERFLKAAKQEWAFLDKWFEGKGLRALGRDVQTKRLLFKYTSQETGKTHELVRERPSVYADGSDVEEYRERLIWAGDQGLILGGLVDFMIALGGPKNPKYHEFLGLTRQILDSVMDFLVTENKQGDMQLLPYRDGDGCQSNDDGECDPINTDLHPCSPLPDTSSNPPVPNPGVVPMCPKVPPLDPSPNAWGAPGRDAWDYNTGVGIYMNYLLYAFNNNTDLKAHILNDQKSSYITFLKSYGRQLSKRTINDQPIKNSRSITFDLRPCLTPCNLPKSPFMGRLGALVAAMQIIKESEY